MKTTGSFFNKWLDNVEVVGGVIVDTGTELVVVDGVILDAGMALNIKGLLWNKCMYIARKCDDFREEKNKSGNKTTGRDCCEACCGVHDDDVNRCCGQ